MTYLSRDDILKAEDLKIQEVEIPDWGGIVRVRELNGVDRDTYEASLMRILPDGKVTPNLENRRAKLVALSVINEDGTPMFGLSDVLELGTKSAANLELVAEVSERLSGLTEEAVTDAVGNSEAAPGGDSASD